MESPDASTWAPQSPDLSGYHSQDLEPVQHQRYRGSVSHSTPFSPPTSSPGSQFKQDSYKPQPMPPSIKDERDDDGEYYPDASAYSMPDEKPPRSRKVKTEGNGINNLIGTEHIEVKTKFPVARIKRIMQADDDVGKVAQVTPVAVSKALELFMISLVTKAAAEAKARSSKRVTSAHLKQAVTKDEQFDFLSEIVSKVADAPAAAEKSEDVAMDGEGKKKKGGARKKRKADDDDF